MPKTQQPYNIQYDLSNCDAEPLHRIRLFQEHALLLAVEKQSLSIQAFSDNATSVFPYTHEQLLAFSLYDLLVKDTISYVNQFVSQPEKSFTTPFLVLKWKHADNNQYPNLLLRETEHHLLLEFESRDEKLSQILFLQQIDHTLLSLQNNDFDDNLFTKAATATKKLTSFDRVMIYRFDKDYNGEVIAEAKEPDLQSFLHLRYPHTDIPKQARDLYLRNQIRQITTTELPQKNFIHFSDDSPPLDLSLVANRGASPIHLEYLNNMGVGASLSVAIIVNNKLWGLIACHHNSAKQLDCRLRTMISFFAKIISGQLALQETVMFRQDTLKTNFLRSHLFKHMSENFDILGGLSKDPSLLLQLMNADGVALYFDNNFRLFGHTPKREELQTVLALLAKREESLYSTSHFFEELEPARNWQNPPAGLLSLRISQQPEEYIIWFRPEVTKTIKWGGNPNNRKLLEDGKVRLHPLLSFQQWEQQLKGFSTPWEPHKLDTALSLRNDIKEIIIQKYQEVRRLNQDLTEAYQELEGFSYTVSHDLRGPLRTIKGFAEILQEDYYDQLDNFGHSVLETIVSSVAKMNQFINDILQFSRLGKREIIVNKLPLESLINETWQDLTITNKSAQLAFTTSLPVIAGDRVLIKQLFENLLSNAIKYAKENTPPSINISASEDDDYHLIEITDQGIGFDMKHVERIFVVFERLISSDKYEGTGIGLSIVKRAIDKHQGKIWVESELGVGTTFFLAFRKDLAQRFEEGTITNDN